MTPPAPALNGQAVPDNGTSDGHGADGVRSQGSPTRATVHTKVTLYVVETGESAAGATGSPVAYSQAATADTTQTLRKQGFERIVEESTSLSSGTAATGDVVVQTVRCYDSDSNALRRHARRRSTSATPARQRERRSTRSKSRPARRRSSRSTTAPRDTRCFRTSRRELGTRSLTALRRGGRSRSGVQDLLHDRHSGRRAHAASRR